MTFNSRDFVLTVKRFQGPTTHTVLISAGMGSDAKYLQIMGYVFRTETSSTMLDSEICLNYFHRRQLKVGPGDRITASTYQPNEELVNHSQIVTVEVDTVKKVDSTHYDEVIDSEDLKKKIHQDLAEHVFLSNQKVAFDYKELHLLLTFQMNNYCMMTPSTTVNLKRSRNFMLKMTAIGKGEALPRSKLVNDSYNLEQLGIGGLNKQFHQIFRRAFASRLYPFDVIRRCGIKHVKGIVLYGPSGTGKTLLARQIGKMLNCKEIVVVNGPELLNRFVGQSEENIRRLFVEAESDYQKFGDGSPLHLIVLDEMDALCKKRGTHQSVAVHDSIVNQLLTKMDGINSLNNILLIGMTNRLDLLDGALLRPGRFEIQIEIGLPDLKGRLEILKIHAKDLATNNLLTETVSLEQLSQKTENYSGAELEGLVKSAVSFALDREMDHQGFVPKVRPDLSNQIKVAQDDFLAAMGEITPAFGTSQSVDRLANTYIPYGLTNYGPTWDHLSNQIDILLTKIKHSSSGKFSVLLRGGYEVGKTALAVHLAIQSNFPFVRLINAVDLIGLSELDKCQHLLDVFNDAGKSQCSVVILDDLERLMEYAELGPRYSNYVLQTVLSLIKKEIDSSHKLVIVGTIDSQVMKLFPILDRTFQINLDVPYLDRTGLSLVIDHSQLIFDQMHMVNQMVNVLSSKRIGIKKLYSILEIVDNNDKISNCQNLLDIIDALT
jgi:vesicle-fusing ATPase